MYQEYDEFCALIRKINNDISVHLLTIDDVIGLTNRLSDIVVSGTKGHMESLDLFRKSLNNISNRTLYKQLEPSRKQMI
jgi:hypothetical protein